MARPLRDTPFPVPQFHGATTMNEKGQVVIPASVRKALDLEGGDKLLVFVMGGSVMLSPVAEMEKFAAHLAGRAESMRAAIKAAEPEAQAARKPAGKPAAKRGRAKHERGDRSGR